ncbi:MAG TPA: NYN domain-containing protein [Chloroflexia bacterium]|nr:NYN domain-containing protein [Chloroflexia bacterium]
MANHFIIDGYNLLKTDPELSMFQRIGLEYAREALIKRVDFAAGLKKASSITVVFDGHTGGQPVETRQRKGRIMIIYSKLGETADDVIKRMVAGYADPDEVKVITRDWELKDAARVAGQSSGVIKRKPQPRHTRSAKDDEDYEGWNNSTKKKGPAKRQPKNARKKGPGNDVYW